jgi:transcription elongation factor GreA
MGESKKYVMTYEGIRKLEEELEYLKTVKRKDITEKIKVALSFGDLSENSEYDEAKNEQAFVEGRIMQLENMLKNANVVDESEISKDVVSVGAKVKVKDLDFNPELDFEEEMLLFIVGSAEADPLENKISNESPIGKGIMNKKVGDVVEIPIPDGSKRYQILEIRRE